MPKTHCGVRDHGSLAAITDGIHPLCSQLNVPTPHVGWFLNIQGFFDEGVLRESVLRIAEALSTVAVVKVADKANSMVWAFWLWDHTEQFLLAENNASRPLSSGPEIKRSLLSAVHTQGWPANSSPSVPLLYALAKAKSLTKESNSAPPHSRSYTSMGATTVDEDSSTRLYTFPADIVAEIPASFLRLRISDLAPWFNSLPSWGCRLIAEADCTQQFDHVHPLSVVNSLIDAGKWLKGKRRWCLTDMVWSVHRDNPVHDRPGAASSSQYDIISRDQLVAIVRFSMLHSKTCSMPP